MDDKVGLELIKEMASLRESLTKLRVEAAALPQIITKISQEVVSAHAAHCATLVRLKTRTIVMAAVLVMVGSGATSLSLEGILKIVGGFLK